MHMIVCTTLAPDGTVGGGLGRAARVGVGTVDAGNLVSWEEVDVAWDRLHDEGGEGAHHARIVRFLREHGVEVVVASHIGAGMIRVLDNMGIRTVLGADGDARAAVSRAAQQPG
jgi:predicted Fe-Mo cluster-binding NifX family protein